MKHFVIKNGAAVHENNKIVKLDLYILLYCFYKSYNKRLIDLVC